MLPGKTYTPEDYLKMAWGRRWLIVLPCLVVAAITAAVTYTLPNQYRASTSILIIPQRVPENYVQSTVTARVDERLQVISQQILSRTRLERIIQEFDLYKNERRSLIMEDVIAMMRRDINVALSNGRRPRDDANSFTVEYKSQNARTAMLVTERLASLFVQENLEERALLADSTSQFLQAQLDDAKRRLVEHEKKLEQFRMANNGRLPSQVQSNLTMLQTTQTRLQSIGDAYSRDRDQLLVVERQLAEAAAAPPPTVPAPAPRAQQMPAVEPGSTPTGSAAQQLQSVRAGLQALEMRLTPEHPDVVRTKRMIAELEVKAEAEALSQPLSAGLTAAGPEAQPDRAAMARLNNLRVTAETLRQRLASQREEEARLQAQIAAYTGKVQAAPSLESDLTELMRDYETLQSSYTSLLKRSEEAKMGANLERRQIGEQFKVIDGARLPEKPFSPDRLRMNLLGALGGFALGVVLVGLLEYRDTSLKTDDDVMTSLALPVLAVIPAMVTSGERARLKRRKLVLASSVSAVGVIAVAVAVAAWRLRLLDNWIR